MAQPELAGTPLAGVAQQFDRLVPSDCGWDPERALSERVADFTDLKKLLDTTDGNLSVHARKLEEAGYIGCTKGSQGGCRERTTALPRLPPGARPLVWITWKP